MGTSTTPGFARRCCFLVRPAWAHTCGCKSRHKLVTASEVKRNCGRATDRGEEARSEDSGLMNKKRIPGVVERGERANDREAPMANARRRRSDSRVSKVDALTWGDLASCPKGQRSQEWSEESAEAVVATTKPVKKPEAFGDGEGLNERTG